MSAKANRSGAEALDMPVGAHDKAMAWLTRTRSNLANSSQPSGPAWPEGVLEMHNYAHEMAIPMDSMRNAARLFKEHAMASRDGNLLRDGCLAKSSFRSLVKQMLDETGVEHEAWRETQIINRVVGTFKSAERDYKGMLNFRDFAIWYSSHCFDEDFLDAKEQALRKLARKLGVSATEVGVYKRHFDRVDADGSGSIDADEFLEMLYEYSKVPKHIGIPHSRVSQLWSAADTDSDGLIDFEDFVRFSKKYF
jgi:hypothetical protein